LSRNTCRQSRPAAVAADGTTKEADIETSVAATITAAALRCIVIGWSSGQTQFLLEDKKRIAATVPSRHDYFRRCVQAVSDGTTSFAVSGPISTRKALAKALERRDLRRGLVTMCAAGGMTLAIIVERM
jgi:Thiolase, C-terminal domain